MHEPRFPDLAAWLSGPEFPRFLADLLAAEFSAMRPGAPPFVAARAAERADCDLETDSLEHLRLALAVAAALRLSDTDEGLRVLRTFPQWVAECRRVARPGAVGFRTSVSSGKPRLIVHGLDALAQEVEAFALLFAGVARIFTLVPAHHIYGFLFTVLLPARLGVEVVDARAQAFPRDLRGDDLVVAFPTCWQALAGSGLPWPTGAKGVSSGAPCPPGTGAALRALGLSGFIEIYGSTETGAIGWRGDESDAFELFPYWRKIGHDRLVKNYGLGECGYDLPDVVAWDGEHRLAPIRRRDGAVQVGGVNVYPEMVRAVLKSHPGVTEATVRLMRSHEGERLKAFIVPRDPEDSPERLRADLEDWIAHRLTAPQRPRAFSFGPSLPVNARGKPCDWPLNAPAGLQGPP